MNRKNRCPYCGKKITYGQRFSYRRKAEFVCPRCGKESRVVINKKVILVFIICAIIAVSIMLAWILLDLISNPLGILAVALPLIIFGLVSPNFVRFEPLKKYQKSMEAKRAGIAYSDNLSISEMDEELGYTEGSNQFQINNDVFNKIKAERTAARPKIDDVELVSDSKEIKAPEEPEVPEKKPYVEVNTDVRENHAGTEEAPLKKLHSEGTKINRSRHYIEVEEPVSAEEAIFGKLEEEKSEPKKSEKNDTNRYSANRRF